MKCYLIDFEDSFTYNVYAELVACGFDVEVFKDSKSKDLLECLVSEEQKCALVLGPGPGHPDERVEIIESISKLLKSESVFILGICLGHQLIARSLGMEVNRCERPIHGENVSIKIDAEWKRICALKENTILVQRYNSLSCKNNQANQSLAKLNGVKLMTHQHDIMGMRGNNFITYQFHPESVGTSFRSSFFKGFKSFLL